MSKGFSISEEIPDREFFTIIPNYIVNHSSIWEQGVYLVMKRIAGEKGRCFATHQTIAGRLQISRPTVSKTIIKLIDRGWIQETGKRVGKTASVKEYQLVNLWELNSKFYREKHQSSKPQNSLSKEKLLTTEPLSSSTVYIEEDRRIKKNIKEEVTNVTATSSQMGVTRIAGFGKGLSKPELNQGMQVLTELLGNTPSYIPKNRFSLKRLIKKWGLEQTLRAIRFAFTIQDKDFAPVITSYMSLERKWDDLEVYARRKTAKAQAADISGTIERRHRGDLAG